MNSQGTGFMKMIQYFFKMDLNLQIDVEKRLVIKYSTIPLKPDTQHTPGFINGSYALFKGLEERCSLQIPY